jgi:hypothetical protein
VELEKLKLSELTCREALSSIAKIIYSVHDDVKDKEFELELRSLHSILRTLNSFSTFFFSVGFAKNQDGSIKRFPRRFVSKRQRMQKQLWKKQAMTKIFELSKLLSKYASPWQPL